MRTLPFDRSNSELKRLDTLSGTREFKKEVLATLYHDTRNYGLGKCSS